MLVYGGQSEFKTNPMSPVSVLHFKRLPGYPPPSHPPTTTFVQNYVQSAISYFHLTQIYYNTDEPLGPPRRRRRCGCSKSAVTRRGERQIRMVIILAVAEIVNWHNHRKRVTNVRLQTSALRSFSIYSTKTIRPYYSRL